MLNEIASAYLTTSGAVFGQSPRHSVMQRAMSAARAGFGSIGCCDLEDVPASLPVPVRELEWFDLTQPDWDTARRMFATADRIGTVRRIHAGSAYRTPGNAPESRVLRDLAIMAAGHGLTVCVEAVAFGRIPAIEGICQVIREAGQPNAGLLLDIWHMRRTHGRIWIPRDVPIASVQIAGTDPRQSASMVRSVALHDAMWRTLPDSEPYAAEISAFCRDLLATGYDGPVCAEIPMHTFRMSRDCDGMAGAAYRSLSSVAGLQSAPALS